MPAIELPIVHSNDLSGLRIYIYETNGYHRGGLTFGHDTTFPDIPIAAAKRAVDSALREGREVRITNSLDFLVFHVKDGAVIWPIGDPDAFWRKVEGRE